MGWKWNEWDGVGTGMRCRCEWDGVERGYLVELGGWKWGGEWGGVMWALWFLLLLDKTKGSVMY